LLFKLGQTHIILLTQSHPVANLEFNCSVRPASSLPEVAAGGIPLPGSWRGPNACASLTRE
jgi:hypothetical protein